MEIDRVAVIDLDCKHDASYVIFIMRMFQDV
jgi:hypothetical protein